MTGSNKVLVAWPEIEEFYLVTKKTQLIFQLKTQHDTGLNGPVRMATSRK